METTETEAIIAYSNSSMIYPKHFLRLDFPITRTEEELNWSYCYFHVWNVPFIIITPISSEKVSNQINVKSLIVTFLYYSYSYLLMLVVENYLLLILNSKASHVFSA